MHESDADLISLQDQSIELTIEDNVRFLDEHPRYDPVTTLFKNYCRNFPGRAERAEEIRTHNLNVVIQDKRRAERIYSSLALASGIDILYGHIPIQGQFFRVESDDDTN